MSVKLLPMLLLMATSNLLAQTTDTTKFTETKIEVPAVNIVLHGTLTVPKLTKGIIPIVLIIAGSGATDRDGNNIAAGLNCDSYKQLSNGLAKSNIASLRYDKRGVGESKSIQKTDKPKLFDDEIDDAKAIVSFLKKDKRFSQVIIAGHSQGALVGLLATKGAKKYISLCGVGLSGQETLKQQLAAQPAFVSEKANPIIDSLVQGFYVQDVPQFLEPLFKKSLQPYLMSWFKYNPATELSKLKIPALVIQGDNDFQISVSDAQKFVFLSPSAKLIILSGMNHVFKIAPTDKSENFKTYSNPKLMIVDKLVNEVVNFIKN